MGGTGGGEPGAGEPRHPERPRWRVREFSRATASMAAARDRGRERRLTFGDPASQQAPSDAGAAGAAGAVAVQEMPAGGVPGGTTTVDLRNVFGAGRPPLELAAAAGALSTVRPTSRRVLGDAQLPSQAISASPPG